MGRAAREKPARLGEKLAKIREILGLSQNEMVSELGMKKKLIREDISKFERGVREPSLPTLLKYARLANVSTDVLIDDELDLLDQ